MPRKRRGQKPRPLRASLAELSGWSPNKMPAPASAAPPSTPRKSDPPIEVDTARTIIAVLQRLPRLAAEVGLAVATEGSVELLPGSPATLVFISRGRLRGAFVLPTSSARAAELLGMSSPTQRDRLAERMFEEERRDDHARHSSPVLS